MKYTKTDLEYLKSMYDRYGRSSSRGGVNADEFHALKKAGLIDERPAEPDREPQPEPDTEQDGERADGRTRPEVRRAVLDAITRLTDAGQPQSIRQVADMLHLTNPTVQYHINKLRDDGLLVKDRLTGHWMPAGSMVADRTKRELVLDHCRQRIEEGMTPTAAETAETLGLNHKTCANIMGRLRNEGLLPAATPSTKTKPKTKPKTKENHMGDNTPTQAERMEQAIKENADATQKLTPTATPQDDTDMRTIIADRLGTLHNAMLGVLSASFDAGDKVAYAYACKLLSGEIMDLKTNYCQEES